MKTLSFKHRNSIWIALAALTVVGSAEARDQECKSGAPVVAKITHAADESLTCLDSVSADGKIQALVLSTKEETTSTGGRNETNVAIVVTGTLNAAGTEVAQLDATVRLADPALFLNGCGAYLKGGLVLPGTSKIALVYAMQIRTVDYADASHPVVKTVNDRSIPGMASTCEGYIPNWNGGRDGITVDGSAKTLALKITAREPVEQPEPKTVSGDDAHKFYSKAYDLECGSGSPERKSGECKDLKQARDLGVFTLRKMVRPVQTVVINY